MVKLNGKRAEDILSNISGKSIAVIGDVMLDRYFWGSVSRISPEAPVPVIDIERETFHLGGAANVAKNLKTLGARPFLCGVIGADYYGRTFTEIARGSGIDTDGLYPDDVRPTTVKTRIIGNNQHIARLDREITNPLSEAGEQFIIDKLETADSLCGVIFEDYDKGAIERRLIERVSAFCRKRGIPVFVDPKFDNFFSYKDCFLFKPNRKEAEKALGFKLTDKESIRAAGAKLLNLLNCENVLITLGAEGMTLFERGGDVSGVRTRARQVADVSGAGDTAIATLAAAIAGGAKIKEAAAMANFASGIVCEKPGIVAIEPEDLINSINLNGSR